MRKPTQQAGAQKERDDIRAYLRRRHAAILHRPTGTPEPTATEEIERNLDWLSKRAARFHREAGGLGGARGGR